ncbi:glycosyltransferase [Candidatus Poribacteria bacterium]|nr:glycosyltransferase [Candidatus Poribacteria bacterium]
MRTRTLLLWPGSVADFTSSDSYYQVPRIVAAESDAALVCGGNARLPDGYPGTFAEVLTVPANRVGYVRESFRAARARHEAAPFDRIVSAFDGRAILAAARLQRLLRIPWFAVCEDHPFGERYRDAEHSRMMRLGEALHTGLWRRHLSRAHRIVTFINAGVLDFLRLPPGRIVPLCNAADLDRLDPIRESAGAPEPDLIGYLGYASDDKGALEMAAALTRVRRTLPGTRLLMAGAIQPGIQERLRAVCADGWELTGLLAPDEALRRIARCSVCWSAYRSHPWLYHNQVLKVCEYMALARPVVAVETPGTRDLIVNGAQGFLVECQPPEKTVDQLAVRTEELLRDHRLAGELGRAGLRTVRDRLNWRLMGERFAAAVFRDGREASARPVLPERPPDA